MNCGSLNSAREIHLYTPSFGQDPADTDAEPGDILDLETVDFEDGYFTLRRPSSAESTVIALEVWGCRVCLRTQGARLRFEREDSTHYRFLDAEAVPLSANILDDAHFISRSLEELAPNPGDDANRIRELLGRFAQRS